jgi:hypothetical protein
MIQRVKEEGEGGGTVVTKIVRACTKKKYSACQENYEQRLEPPGTVFLQTFTK